MPSRRLDLPTVPSVFTSFLVLLDPPQAVTHTHTPGTLLYKLPIPHLMQWNFIFLSTYLTILCLHPSASLRAEKPLGLVFVFLADLLNITTFLDLIMKGGCASDRRIHLLSSAKGSSSNSFSHLSTITQRIQSWLTRQLSQWPRPPVDSQGTFWPSPQARQVPKSIPLSC